MTQENLVRFEFRNIKKNEAEQTAEIERICFPPNEACTPEMMHLRVEKVPEMFLVAVNKATGKIAGFINGLSTNETVLRDEFFQNADLYDPAGENVMILGVDVLPEYRRIGLASEMMECYKNRERQNGRKRLILTCLESKVAMYRKMGYEDNGMSVSSWGGEQWHEMTCKLGKGIPEQLQRQRWSLDKEKEYAYIRSSQKI
ncbi:MULTISPECIES: GNAT family N-acetyltransferase [unclassified Clostridium]|uniref:GNAT family N-acetyltransferase n=1 Tax=unclassified Clostridium TaxID=2614128 RepID=UPI000E467F30|nr:GNAT family N-acetyltransferase [Clostridium sp. AM54-37XD]RHP98141.1 GNAT family N-acetyltransferase [Clostridium sp. AM54-14XD]